MYPANIEKIQVDVMLLTLVTIASSVNWEFTQLQIVLEGPDNAGKSTLAAFLAGRLNIPLQHSGGPSKSPGEVNERTVNFNRLSSARTMIFDRHPAVSQNIYQKALETNGELVNQNHIIEFYELKPLIIYCRNERGLEEHVLSEHSSSTYFDEVKTHFGELTRRYDLWAMQHANHIYRIGDSMEDVASMIEAMMFGSNAEPINSFNPWGDMVDFHTKFDLAYNGKPRQLPADIAKFREGFMGEELEEYLTARHSADSALLVGNDEADFIHNLELEADALVDLCYVAIGTAYLHGFDFPQMWQRVHDANMKKVRATAAEQSLRGSTQDVIKPAGWEPPKHTDLIEDHEHSSTFASGV